jgi:Ca2+-binding RTX toxin-like protein
MAVIMGTNNSERLDGTLEDDTLYGLGGNDHLYAVYGHDILYGGDDGDYLVVNGTNTAELYGENGNDSLNGDTGTDLLNGGPGNDYLNGSYGADTYVFDWSEVAGAKTYFRNGDTPSVKANAKAWDNYYKQAEAAGYQPESVIDPASGKEFFKYYKQSETIYTTDHGRDGIESFNFAEGDRLKLDGITDKDSFLQDHFTATADNCGQLRFSFDDQAGTEVSSLSFFSMGYDPAINYTDWFIT